MTATSSDPEAFVRNFSEGLHDEHRGTPLSVTCICPGGTETAFHAASGGWRLECWASRGSYCRREE